MSGYWKGRTGSYGAVFLYPVKERRRGVKKGLVKANPCGLY